MRRRILAVSIVSHVLLFAADAIDVDELGGGRKSIDTALSELVTTYVTHEERYLVSTVQKAIEMDEADSDSPTSKMVDYVFFVLQKRFRASHRASRSLSRTHERMQWPSRRQQSGRRCGVRHRQYCQLVPGLVSASAAADVAASGRQPFAQPTSIRMALSPHRRRLSKQTQQRIPYAVPLNNVAQSSEFVMRLRNELEAASQKHFAGQPRELAKLDVCWNELAQTSAAFKASLQGA